MTARIEIAFNPAPAADSAKNTTAGAGSLTSHDMTAGRTPMLSEPESRRFGPIEDEPHSLRPPYDRADSVLAHGPGPDEPTDIWRERLRTARKATLYQPLEGLDVSGYEYQQLHWLCESEDHVIAVIAALLHRARAAAPLAQGGHLPQHHCSGGESR